MDTCLFLVQFFFLFIYGKGYYLDFCLHSEQAEETRRWKKEDRWKNFQFELPNRCCRETHRRRQWAPEVMCQENEPENVPWWTAKDRTWPKKEARTESWLRCPEKEKKGFRQ